MTAFSFNESYRGTPPWDIGRPQREFVELVEGGIINGEVLDVGCGTGENALFFASRGAVAWGIDASPLAIEKAKAKARGSKAMFTVGDALNLMRLGKKFDTITDSGLFHVFADPERLEFVKSLRSALNQRGTYFMLAFSDREPTGWGGPRRLSREEIFATFPESNGWTVNWVREAKFESNFHEDGGFAWLSSISLA